MLGHIEMQYLATTVFQHDEYEQHSHRDRRHRKEINRHHALNESAYLDGGRRSAAAPAIHPGQMRPELPEALPLPPDDRVGLNVQQRSAPGAPNARQTDPEQPIETGQHRSFPLSPEGSELQAESSVFDSNGLVSAQQETNESNHRQKKGWHVSRLFAFIRFEVNLLWT